MNPYRTDHDISQELWRNFQRKQRGGIIGFLDRLIAEIFRSIPLTMKVFLRQSMGDATLGRFSMFLAVSGHGLC